MTKLNMDTKVRSLLSLSDLRECERMIAALKSKGDFVTTIYSNAAMYFKRNGFQVSRQGIGFIVTK